MEKVTCLDRMNRAQENRRGSPGSHRGRIKQVSADNKENIFCLISEDSRKLLRSLGMIGIIDYEYFNTHSNWGIENYLEKTGKKKRHSGELLP